LSRQLSPVWLVLITIACALTMSPERRRELVRSTAVRRAAIAVVVAALLAVAWLVVERPLTAEKATGFGVEGWNAFGFALGHLGDVYKAAVGYFGWLDVSTPYFTFVVWVAAAAVLVLLCVALCRTRLKVGVLFIAIASALVPAGVEASQLGVLGSTWQGRYTLPLAIGVVLIAGAGLDEVEAPLRDRLSGVARPLLVLLAVGQFLCFYVTLRRYMVSVIGAVWFIDGKGWGPPLPAIVLLLLGLAATVAFYVWADRLIAQSRSDAGSVEAEVLDERAAGTKPDPEASETVLSSSR
jgi:hypothetical protein